MKQSFFELLTIKKIAYNDVVRENFYNATQQFSAPDVWILGSMGSLVLSRSYRSGLGLVFGLEVLTES